MAKYVDIERFPTLPDDPYNKLSEYARGYLDAQENLFNLPVENVEKVIRCKDCDGKESWYKDENGCNICGMSGLYFVDDNDYCSYGEE